MLRIEYAEIIDKWKQGYTIQYKDPESFKDYWKDWTSKGYPPYYPGCEYRLKLTKYDSFEI